MRVIESVEVINQHPDGPDVYKNGGNLYRVGKIADIIENEGVFQLFNEADELVMEIRNCPVVVRYKEVKESEVDQ
jgi:phosphopentomutase